MPKVRVARSPVVEEKSELLKKLEAIPQAPEAPEAPEVHEKPKELTPTEKRFIEAEKQLKEHRPGFSRCSAKKKRIRVNKEQISRNRAYGHEGPTIIINDNGLKRYAHSVIMQGPCILGETPEGRIELVTDGDVICYLDPDKEQKPTESPFC